MDVFAAASEMRGAHVTRGEVVFTQGTLSENIDLRAVAAEDGTRVATWQGNSLASNLEACPWVEDELRFIADYYLGVCGATLGALGSRLDESLRSTLLQKLEVRAMRANRVVVEADAPMDGLYVVGGGSLELLEEGVAQEVLGAGDFLFSTSVMSAAPAPKTARAGSRGALLLYAPRAVVHELVVSVPPLLEVLIG